MPVNTEMLVRDIDGWFGDNNDELSPGEIDRAIGTAAFGALLAGMGIVYSGAALLSSTAAVTKLLASSGASALSSAALSGGIEGGKQLWELSNGDQAEFSFEKLTEKAVNGAVLGAITGPIFDAALGAVSAYIDDGFAIADDAAQIAHEVGIREGLLVPWVPPPEVLRAIPWEVALEMARATRSASSLYHGYAAGMGAGTFVSVLENERDATFTFVQDRFHEGKLLWAARQESNIENYAGDNRRYTPQELQALAKALDIPHD